MFTVCAATPTWASGKAPEYRVTKLESLGGSSVGFGINNRGWVVGRSRQGDNPNVQKAVVWRDGALTPLGALGGEERNSAVRWPVKNVRGIVSGISQTDAVDPNNEFWSCSAFFPGLTATGYQCLGFRWQDGVMQALQPLGGLHSFATGTNNFGITVGWAQTGEIDESCDAAPKVGFKPVLWPAGNARPRALPLPEGASAGAATALNDFGQIVGIAGECDQNVGRNSAKFAVLWQHGRVTKLPTLPGRAWHTPNAITLRGDVVGFGNFSPDSGETLAPHAWLWTREGGLRDLQTLPGDATSEAWGINLSRQVVGRSCRVGSLPTDCRAFLWQRGHLIDLQTRITAGDTLILIAAYDIDDLGRITGQAIDPATGGAVAFLATPIR